MNGFTKEQIMKGAWALAKMGAKKFGGTARQYFSEALKTIWARVKSCVRIPAWFVAKKVGDFANINTKVVKCWIKRETEKAVLVEYAELNEEFWCPKSLLK